ncbi:MAG: hypothetical protein ACE5F9_07170 [Phycisphaerae bacterium]
MTVRSIAVAVLTMLAVSIACPAAPPETEGGGSSTGALPDRQGVIRDRVRRLEDRLFELSKVLRKVEPDRAARLLETLGAARSLRVRQNMDKIVEQLRSGAYSDAVDGQKAVTDDLLQLLKHLLEEPDRLDERKKEIDRLKEAREALNRLIEEQEREQAAAEAAARPDGDQEQLDQQAEAQRETGEKTKVLADQMKGGGTEASKGDGDAGGGGNGGPPGGGKSGGEQDPQEGASDDQPLPGQQDIEGAVPLQEDAAKALDRQAPAEAAEKQAEAVKKLKQAQDQLDDVLEQLRREQQEEMLAALEARFRAMLARQLECNKATGRLAVLGKAQWKRSDQLELAELSQRQRWVGNEAGKALDLLVEEGTTVVFPQVVEQVRDDGLAVADRLAAADVGGHVRAMQADIVDVIRQLLDAVKRKQEELEDGGAGGGGGGNSPLLPGSAELKLLKACQLRVNAATEAIDVDRWLPSVTVEELNRRLEMLRKRQEQVSEMARAMYESMTRAQ